MRQLPDPLRLTAGGSFGGSTMAVDWEASECIPPIASA
jgi:hypothetical protein